MTKTTEFKNWVAGVFDMRGRIRVENNGRVKIKIWTPRMYQCARIKRIYGGSVYKDSRNRFANSVIEIGARGRVVEFIEDVLGLLNGQEHPLRMVWLYMKDAQNISQVQESLDEFYRVYWSDGWVSRLDEHTCAVTPCNTCGKGYDVSDAMLKRYDPDELVKRVAIEEPDFEEGET